MKVEVSIYASSLKNVAGTFKGTSDPFAVVTQVAATTGTKPKVLGKTEIVKNSLSPKWAKVFYVDCELGTPMRLAVNIFDEVKKGENKGMGSAVFDVGECLGARGNTKAKKLRQGGSLFCSVRKSEGSGVLRLKMVSNEQVFLNRLVVFFAHCSCVLSNLSRVAV
jgi:Ca2+-dependent lipid-binding protein